MSTVATMSNSYFWFYTVGLLLFWVIVITTAAPRAQKSTTLAKFWGKNPAQEQRLESSCRSLCEQCGCIGFYCGEQCLCEYDKRLTNRGDSATGNDTKISARSEGECIAAMQRRARKQSLPFDIFIQGPSSERFIRTAMKYEMDKTRAAAQLMNAPPKRSTIAIYQPYAPTKSKSLKAIDARSRRSTDHLDWFSDFANTLVRPAPLRKADGSNKKRETQHSEDDSGDEKPDSWFSDHPNRLLRPAPIFRRHKSQKEFSEESDDEPRDSQEAPMPRVGHLIKNTIRNIQESDFGENLRAGLRDGTEMLQNTFQGTNLELVPKRLRNDFVEVFDSWLKSQQVTEPSIVMPPRTSPHVFLPWFRPVRFLQRVQQALN
ncbi:uncharacterized protein LOC105213991 [Zeugodacus cucurbitae]|uniref:uncharacterized protein LOC105213991 n=1 Tax=Zeugodacus cucurbitae TaxID=28588 RepID=UPI0023D91E88|nr:uncharacterized protein LOC105213991 [Zeugodacus cucurbitae]